jgi:hypothetical protein
MINQFKELLHNENFKSKILNISKVFDCPSSSLITYLGINYTKNYISSLKFYFVTTKKINLQLIEKDFPFINEIEDVYSNYVENNKLSIENLGISFGLKINSDGNISYSYYQQIENYENVIESIKFPAEEISIRNNYYVLEKKDNKIYKKQYLIVTKNENKHYLSSLFNLKNIYSSQIKSIEFCEFNSEKKINFYPINKSVLENYLHHISNEVNDLVRFMKEEYNLYPNFPGIYLDTDLKSIYFFNKTVDENFFENHSIVNNLFL